MEKHIHVIHAENGPLTQTESMDYEITPGTPIAKVTSVTAGSPADEAVSLEIIHRHKK